MTTHLYLAQLSLISGPPMVTATTPEAAINLLRTGVVTRLSISENWSSACDPENLVAAFFKQATQAGEISLPEWKEESLMDLTFSPEVIAKQLAERSLRRRDGRASARSYSEQAASISRREMLIGSGSSGSESSWNQSVASISLGSGVIVPPA